MHIQQILWTIEFLKSVHLEDSQAGVCLVLVVRLFHKHAALVKRTHVEMGKAQRQSRMI